MSTKNNPGEFDCYANAEPDEPMFVLLGRDPMAAALVRIWALMREHVDQEQADEAHRCALQMEEWCRSKGKHPLSMADVQVFLCP